MKKQTDVPQEKNTEIKAQKDKKSYFEIPLPKFRYININPYFAIISMLVFAFLLGMLTNKLLFMQNELARVQGTNQGAVIDNTANANQFPTPQPKVDVEPGTLPILGSADAPVTIVEFSDIQCPFCKRFVDDAFVELKTKYIDTGKVKLAFRHYPLTSIHPNAKKAGEAVECANEQNKFWDYHDLLFAKQDEWSQLASADAVNSFVDYSGELGLDTAQFRNCLDSSKFQQKVEDDLAAGMDAGVDGTPAFFINGWRLTGAQPFASFEQLIEQELNK